MPSSPSAAPSSPKRSQHENDDPQLGIHFIQPIGADRNLTLASDPAFKFTSWVLRPSKKPIYEYGCLYQGNGVAHLIVLHDGRQFQFTRKHSVFAAARELLVAVDPDHEENNR